METDLDPVFLNSEEFRQVSAEWLALVRQFAETGEATSINPAELKVGTLVSQLTIQQLIAIILVLVGALISVASLSFKAGQEWERKSEPAGASSDVGPAVAPATLYL